jgi:hypothetical protein
MQKRQHFYGRDLSSFAHAHLTRQPAFACADNNGFGGDLDAPGLASAKWRCVAGYYDVTLLAESDAANCFIRRVPNTPLRTIINPALSERKSRDD